MKIILVWGKYFSETFGYIEVGFWWHFWKIEVERKV